MNATKLAGRAMAVLDLLAGARGFLFPLVPVFLGSGIAAYFLLPVEPALELLGVGAGIALVFGGLWLFGPERWQPVAAALILLASGFVLAAERAHRVGAPVLTFRYYGPIEGRIIEIDRSNSDRLRLTLDQVSLQRVEPERTPARVRVSLMTDQPHIALEPGLRVMLTGHLGPPGRPVEPGGFDFRRNAWFEQLGGLGYTRNPVMLSEPVQKGSVDLLAARMRSYLSAAVRTAIPGDPGGFAAAVTTGDRSGVSAEVNEAMRASNLTHILSISGMHMGMLAGFVFLLMRSGFALIPWLALRVPAKKLAAVVALGASAFYLMLAGRDVATERSFIMVAMMLVAVLFDRRAISLRSVAMGALIVLLLRPESLLNPGFQMSFAATVALVAGFGWVAAWKGERPWPRLMEPLVMAFFSSALAGAATLPFAAAIFNRIAEYGLVANLLAGPAMGILVMPGAVIAALLAPFGLAGPALWVVGLGSWWIIRVAEVIAALEGSVSAVSTPPAVVIPLLTFAGIWTVMIPGRLRWCGLPAVLVAVGIWTMAERPQLLIAESGALSGAMIDGARVLNKPKGDSFAAESWLTSDGEMTEQAVAGRREGMDREAGLARYSLAGREIWHFTGRGAAERAQAECRSERIVITSAEMPPGVGDDCLLIDPAYLSRTGALSLDFSGDELAIRSVAETAGRRLWTGAL